MKEFYKIHRIFKSCEDLETVKKHIDKLFADKKIKLTQEKEDSIIFNIKALNISEEVKIEIQGERIITDEKDEALMKLYEIEKDQIKLMKEIKNYIKYEQNNSEIIDKIKGIFQS